MGDPFHFHMDVLTKRQGRSPSRYLLALLNALEEFLANGEVNKEICGREIRRP